MIFDISLASVAYLGATILFVLCLGGLSNQETSRRGNLYGMVGMAIAVIATIFGPRVTPAGYPYILGAMVVGAVIGLYAARKVQMTQMPELVALMHSLVGLAACLVGYANFIDPAVSVGLTPAENTIHEIEMYLGVLIGAVTFSGSVIAFGKLSAKISGKPMLLPGRHWLNLAGLLLVFYFGYRFVNSHSVAEGMTPMIVMTVVALLFGVHMVMAIGGADMPVVVSMLNSYSGWAAGGDGLHAEQRLADCRRRAGRQQRRDPLLHHVQRDEPQFPWRHRGRIRHRRRRSGARRAKARSPPAR
jgi:NAD(P) transhydrogenase subunit beta